MRFKDTLGLSLYLRNLQNEMHKRIDANLKPLHLTSAQYSTLSAIEEGDAKAITSAALARSCYVTPQTMNRILHNLNDDRFVHRSPEAKQSYALTKKAIATLCDSHILVNDLECKMVAGFSKKETQQLLSFLKRCFENLHEAPKKA
jgi:DNA-binding MarR family transcriptional regulator